MNNDFHKKRNCTGDARHSTLRFIRTVQQFNRVVYKIGLRKRIRLRQKFAEKFSWIIDCTEAIDVKRLAVTGLLPAHHLIYFHAHLALPKCTLSEWILPALNITNCGLSVMTRAEMRKLVAWCHQYVCRCRYCLQRTV